MEDKTGYGFGDIDFGFKSKGDDVMKSIGSLKELTGDLTNATKDCDKSAEEVESWLTIIGHALLSIFK